MAAKHFKEAALVIRKTGEKPVEYLKTKMEVIGITAVSRGGSGGEDRLTENITINLSKVGPEYLPQNDKEAQRAVIPRLAARLVWESART